jgi:hypothetical protein
MNEVESPLPMDREYVPGVMWDYFHKFVAEGMLQDNRRLVLFDGSRAYSFLLTESDGTIKYFTVDMDDTLVDYTEAKERFHTEVIHGFLANSGLEVESLEKLLKLINKAARLLPASGVHPEAYNPTLEVLALSNMAVKLKQGTYGEGGLELEQALSEYGDEELNRWVRHEFVAPLIQGEEALLPTGVLHVEEGESKTYFLEGFDKSPLLATAEDDREVALIADGLGLAVDLREVFEGIYKQFQSYIFEPEINTALVPTEAAGGRFILATFGETRFQLIKVKRLLKRMRAAGLRLPDQILFFEEGRKAPVIDYLQQQRLFGEEEDIDVIHVDNSESQCAQIKKQGNEHMRTVWFNMKQDWGKTFEEMMHKLED